MNIQKINDTNKIHGTLLKRRSLRLFALSFIIIGNRDMTEGLVGSYRRPVYSQTRPSRMHRVKHCMGSLLALPYPCREHSPRSSTVAHCARDDDISL